jgi:nitrogen fixation/metabolism regulation signal transduction histidine kinase
MDGTAPARRAIFDSLVFKMSFFVSFIMLLSLLIISTVFIFSERQKITSDIVKTGEIFANSTVQKIYADYVQFYTHPTPEDFENFKTFTQATLKNNQDVADVSMIAFNGRILFDSNEFTTGKATTERNVSDPTLLTELKSESTTSRVITVGKKDVTEIVVPLQEQAGGHVISVRYVISNQSLSQRMNEIYRQLALVIIPLMLLVIVVAIPYTIAFTKPIRTVTKAAEDVRSGNLDVQTNIKGKDEIGTLASIFDQMVLNIKNSRAELEKYSKTLEQQVADRTKQLEESKKTLEEKLIELERMNKLMVGRELKMTELKKEIEDLNAKLAAPKI